MYDNILMLFVHRQPQANPVDLSSHLPGKRMHIKAIATGLQHIRPEILYAMHALSYYFSGDLPAYDPHTVSKVLTSSVVCLEGLLDGLTICALPEGTPASRGMNFRATPFTDPRTQSIQEQLKGLKSFSGDNSETYADLWTIADFLKHYLPCLPLPTELQGRVDFQVELGCGKSGPLLHDLVLPAFNYACEMVAILGQQLGVAEGDWLVPRID